MNDLLDDFTQSQPAAPASSFQQQQQQAPKSRSSFHRRGASAPAEQPAPSGNPFQSPIGHQSSLSQGGRPFANGGDLDSAYGGEGLSSVPELPRSQSAQTGWLAKAKSKMRNVRGKSIGGEENQQLNTSPMQQGQANGHAKEAAKPASSKQQQSKPSPKKKQQQQQQQQDEAQQRAPNPQAAQMIKASMDPFFADVTEVKALLAKIRQQAQEVEVAHQRAKLCTTGAEAKAAQGRVQHLVQDVTRSVKQCKDRLTQLEDQNEEIIEEAEAAGVQETSEIRMRLSIMTGLHVKLQDQAAAFGSMRARWAEEDKAEVGRQLYTVTGQHFEDEELQAVVESGEAHSIYQRALMAPGQSMQLTKEMVSQIEQRHSEMAELERSLLDLHQIFLDMSVLVAGQAEMLDRIEGWVMSTQEQMRLALADLQKAKVSRRAAQQKRAVTFATGVGLVGVGAGISATGAGAVIGVPIALVGAAVAGASAVL